MSSNSLLVVDTDVKDVFFILGRVAAGIKYINNMARTQLVEQNLNVWDINSTVTPPEFIISNPKSAQMIMARLKTQIHDKPRHLWFSIHLDTDNDYDTLFKGNRIVITSGTDDVSLSYMKAIGLSLSCLGQTYYVEDTYMDIELDTVRSLPRIKTYEEMRAYNLEDDDNDERCKTTFNKWLAFEEKHPNRDGTPLVASPDEYQKDCVGFVLSMRYDYAQLAGREIQDVLWEIVEFVAPHQECATVPAM